MITTGYHELNLIYFFTAGEKEVWCRLMVVSCKDHERIFEHGRTCLVLDQREACRTFVSWHLVFFLPCLFDSVYCLLSWRLLIFFQLFVFKVRCWTVYKGALAPQAAGVIHSDFERGFIKAEIAAFADFKVACVCV